MGECCKVLRNSVIPEGWLTEFCCELDRGDGKEGYSLYQGGRGMTSRKGQWPAFWELSKHTGAEALQMHTLHAVSWKRGSHSFGKEETPQYSKGSLVQSLTCAVTVPIYKPSCNFLKYGAQSCSWYRAVGSCNF